MFGLLVHINGDYSLVEVDNMVITVNSSYFAINQDHIRTPDLLRTIGYIAGTAAKVYIRLCHRPDYTHHSSDCPSTAAVDIITCCRCFRIWFYVVAVPVNSPHCSCLWFFFPG